MPEGPSIILVKEAVRHLVGLTIIEATGNTPHVDFGRLQGTRLKSVRTWGKHLLLKCDTFTLRIHFLMFGTYAIDKPKPGRTPKLALKFEGYSALFFYACAVRTIEGPVSHVYDWSADVMNDQWNTRTALARLKARKTMLICDALLDQEVFSGVGNIIKNEVLFRMRIHPLNKVQDIPRSRLKLLADDARRYSFLFLEWKREFSLKKHWQAYTKKKCPRDGSRLTRIYAGTTKRRTFFCDQCQELFV